MKPWYGPEHTDDHNTWLDVAKYKIDNFGLRSEMRPEARLMVQRVMALSKTGCGHQCALQALVMRRVFTDSGIFKLPVVIVVL